MKSILTIIALTLFLSFQTFPQDRNLKEYLSNRLTPEKTQEIFDLKSDGYSEFEFENSEQN